MELIKGPIEGAQKVCLYGVEGIGKSYFASRFPNPVFIDTEGSTKHMDVTRLPKPSSWSMLLEEVKYIRDNPTICDSLIIDTADWAEMLCVADICAKSKKSGIEDFGYGRGYIYLAEEFGRLLNLLDEVINRNIHVVLVAHAYMRKFEQPDEMGAYDRWELKLQKKTAPMIKEWADLVLFCNYKTYVVNTDGQGADKGTNKAQGGKRVMYTTHHPCWDAKNRQDLPDILDFDFNQIAFMFPGFKGAEAPVDKPQQAPPPPAAAPVEQQSFEEATNWNNVGTEVGRERRDGTVDWNIPKPLLDLMKTNDVSPEEVQRAVAGKGYYPIDMPIKDYDPKFIDGVLIAAWPKVLGMIIENREIPL